MQDKALQRYGWTDHERQLLADAAGELDDVGRVARVDRGECDLVTAAGGQRVLSDSHRAQDMLAPVVGDWVLVGDDVDLDERAITAVLPRRTVLVRRDPAEVVTEQVLVANVDLVGVVCGIDRPCSVARIERFLVVAADGGADAIVVLAKTDIEDHDAGWDELDAQLGGVPVLRTSAQTGAGLEDLTELLMPHRTVVFLGESGSGKSSLVNAMVGDEVQAVGEVRGDAKGRHTTTARELRALPAGGVVIDTPGIRGVGLWDARPGVERVFADIADLAHDCRFRDCCHQSEPGCAVRAAIDDGDLDPARFERYLRLVAELDDQDADREQQRRRRPGRSR